jgi:hypothetical protein
MFMAAQEHRNRNTCRPFCRQLCDDRHYPHFRGIQGVNQGPEQVLAGLLFIAVINMGVAVIEALMTGLVVSYIGKMRPDLLDGQK